MENREGILSSDQYYSFDLFPYASNHWTTICYDFTSHSQTFLPNSNFCFTLLEKYFHECGRFYLTILDKINHFYRLSIMIIRNRQTWGKMKDKVICILITLLL